MKIHFFSLKQLNEEKPPFKLQPLPYDYNALESILDKKTMKFHHDKHHQAYIDKLNDAIKEKKDSLGQIIKNASKFSEKVKNNGGGHWNHSFFWTILASTSSEKDISKEFKSIINKNFKSLDNLKKIFIEEGKNHFGSGWVWLVVTKTKKLKIVTTSNQDNPWMDFIKEGGIPILTIDLWEHAYYLKYKNARPDYLEKIWKLINWTQVESYFNEAKKII